MYLFILGRLIHFSMQPFVILRHSNDASEGRRGRNSSKYQKAWVNFSSNEPTFFSSPPPNTLIKVGDEE